ncbi:MAG: substrate-binding domain-containing protein [Thiolinea sp.]
MNGRKGWGYRWCSNNRRGAALAIRYLHELGHRRIAHITGPQDNILTHAWRTGVQEELQRLGLPLRPEWLIHGDFSLDGRLSGGPADTAMPERPSAVFCASDQMAFGLMAALHAAGVRVPEQLSVMGFDDIELAEYYVPRLTTIRQNRRALGTTAAQRVLAGLKGDAAEQGEECVIEVELVVRDSCQPVHAA